MRNKQKIYIICIFTIILGAVIYLDKVHSADDFKNVLNLGFNSYLRSPIQLSTHDYLVLGYDSFVLGMFLIIIMFNAFYFIFRREKSFIVIILISLIMIVRTMIYGSHFIYYMFPQMNEITLLYLDNITLALLPCAWIAATVTCLPVNIPKFVIVLSAAFAVISSTGLFVIPVSAIKFFEISIGIVLLITCIYLIMKIQESVLCNHVNWISAALEFAGITTLSLATSIDVMQVILSNKIIIGIIPTGFMLLALCWEYYFTYTYEMMMKKQLKVLKELNEANEENRKLELKFLKSQIRPHFIHNALNTIISISRTDPNKSRHLLYEFSSYLRSCYDFRKLDDVVPIEHELSFVRAYVALEQARFLDNLKIEFQLDDIEIDVPPLILQPLAENAIVHNPISREKPLCVFIYVQKHPEGVKIGVQDNGDGFEQEKIRSILSGEMNNRGIGLSNINQRLHSMYHTNLHIESSKEKGTNIYMILPIQGGLNHIESSDY